MENYHEMAKVIKDFSPSVVIHFAQAGVRFSNSEPRKYVDSNLIGTFNLLEILKETSCEHLSSINFFGVWRQ